MWATELNPDFAKVEEELKGQKEPRIGTKQDWYSGSVKYWNEQPATVDGVLGGYGLVH